MDWEQDNQERAFQEHVDRDTPLPSVEHDSSGPGEHMEDEGRSSSDGSDEHLAFLPDQFKTEKQRAKQARKAQKNKAAEDVNGRAASQAASSAQAGSGALNPSSPPFVPAGWAQPGSRSAAAESEPPPGSDTRGAARTTPPCADSTAALALLSRAAAEIGTSADHRAEQGRSQNHGDGLVHPVPMAGRSRACPLLAWEEALVPSSLETDNVMANASVAADSRYISQAGNLTQDSFDGDARHLPAALHGNMQMMPRSETESSSSSVALSGPFTPYEASMRAPSGDGGLVAYPQMTAGQQLHAHSTGYMHPTSHIGAELQPSYQGHDDVFTGPPNVPVGRPSSNRHAAFGHAPAPAHLQAPIPWAAPGGHGHGGSGSGPSGPYNGQTSAYNWQAPGATNTASGQAGVSNAYAAQGNLQRPAIAYHEHQPEHGYLQPPQHWSTHPDARQGAPSAMQQQAPLQQAPLPLLAPPQPPPSMPSSAGQKRTASTSNLDQHQGRTQDLAAVPASMRLPQGLPVAADPSSLFARRQQKYLQRMQDSSGPPRVQPPSQRGPMITSEFPAARFYATAAANQQEQAEREEQHYRQHLQQLQQEVLQQHQVVDTSPPSQTNTSTSQPRPVNGPRIRQLPPYANHQTYLGRIPNDAQNYLAWSSSSRSHDCPPRTRQPVQFPVSNERSTLMDTDHGSNMMTANTSGEPRMTQALPLPIVAGPSTERRSYADASQTLLDGRLVGSPAANPPIGSFFEANVPGFRTFDALNRAEQQLIDPRLLERRPETPEQPAAERRHGASAAQPPRPPSGAQQCTNSVPHDQGREFYLKVARRRLQADAESSASSRRRVSRAPGTPANADGTSLSEVDEMFDTELFLGAGTHTENSPDSPDSEAEDDASNSE